MFPPIASLESERQQLIGQLFRLILIIAVFEGSVRKWIDPTVGNILIPIRDALAIWAVALGLASGLMTEYRKLFSLYLCFVISLIVWGCLQLLVNQSPPILLAVGLRYWVLYYALAIVVAGSTTSVQKVALCKLLVVLLVVSCPLAIAQHNLPPGHFINFQLDTEESQIFRVAGDIVRTSGTFSFTTGFALFLALLTPIVLTNSIAGQSIIKNSLLRGVTIIALVACALVSGSRTAVINCFLMMLIFAILNIFTSTSVRGIYYAIFGALSLVLLAGVVAFYFDDAAIALADRFATANETENIFDRIIATFLGEPEIRDLMTFWGNGFGTGTNLASYFLTGERQFLFGETEPGRVLLEAGAFGAFTIALKFLFIVWSAIRAFLSFTLFGRSSSFFYWMASTVAILTWQNTGQLSVNFLGALAVFLFLADISPQSALRRAVR